MHDPLIPMKAPEADGEMNCHLQRQDQHHNHKTSCFAKISQQVANILTQDQGVAYRIGNLSNADISDFFVYRRVYRIEPPISSISICPRYAFILSFSAENSPKNPKILRKFRKFSGNSENSPKIQKIRRNF